MSSSPDNALQSAFADEFLRRLDGTEEPESAPEADFAGPWMVRAVDTASGREFALLRGWESVERGDLPVAVFRRRETALLAAAVLPAVGREPLFRVASHGGPDGYPVTSAGLPAGRLREFDESFIAALHVAAALVRSPAALALLLEAAGFLALDQVGKILGRRVG
jgi:hypothetical protein